MFSKILGVDGKQLIDPFSINIFFFSGTVQSSTQSARLINIEQSNLFPSGKLQPPTCGSSLVIHKIEGPFHYRHL